MKAKLLNNFCGCCSLKTGTIINGIIGIILAIAGLVLVYVGPLKFKSVVFHDLEPIFSKIIISINLALTILISILLIVGAVIKNTWCMLPDIVVGLVQIICLLISLIYTSVVSFKQDDALDGSLIIGIGLVGLVIFCYLWLVTFSYYMSVKEQENRGFYGRP